MNPNTSNQEKPILEVRKLSVVFDTDRGPLEAVRALSFEAPRGKTVALLGESGCGKSVTGLSILRLVDKPGRLAGGEIILRRQSESCRSRTDGSSDESDAGDGGASEIEDIVLTNLEPDGPEIRRVRGRDISMIFQEPRVSLTPVYTIGEQIIETILVHEKGATRVGARARAVELLRHVGIPAPERRVDEYPHQLSGGMCQRAMIAMALACRPAILIADEPTTALDVTIQAAVLDLLKRLQRELGMTIIMITHDMGVVLEVADEVIVMYMGTAVERAPLGEIFKNPKHPYTRGLLQSVPRPDSDPDQPLLRIKGSVPDLRHVPEGCPFRGRCPEEMNVCRHLPPETRISEHHMAACWLHAADQEWEALEKQVLGSHVETTGGSNGEGGAA